MEIIFITNKPKPRLTGLRTVGMFSLLWMMKVIMLM